MLQCTCACSSQACHVLTCMIGVFVSMHEWVGHLHIGWPRIPFNVNLSPSAFAAPSTSSCRGVQVGVNSAPASISPGPKELHSYSTSRAMMSNRKPRQDKNQRHLCESLKVVALKGRVFEVGETPALQLLFTCTLRLQRHNLGKGGRRGDKRASSSLNRANSLLSNLSARQARMVVTVPGPGSCSSDASCLMVVNTNCSVGCQRGRGKRKQHKQDKSIYTHATQGSHVPIARLSASHLSNNYWICTFLRMRDVGGKKGHVLVEWLVQDRPHVSNCENASELQLIRLLSLKGHLQLLSHSHYLHKTEVLLTVGSVPRLV